MQIIYPSDMKVHCLYNFNMGQLLPVAGNRLCLDRTIGNLLHIIKCVLSVLVNNRDLYLKIVFISRCALCHFCLCNLCVAFYSLIQVLQFSHF